MWMRNILLLSLCPQAQGSGEAMLVLSIELKNSRIIIKNGDYNFLFDNWLGDKAITDSHEVKGQENLMVVDILTNLDWDVHKLHDIVSDYMVDKILDLFGQITSGNDVCIWQPNLEGKFSTKSGWHLIRAQGSVCL